jgi:2-oxoglutarate ferredoxin oxidoreductase subunit gamma
VRKEVRIAGFGGQGIGLAGYILGKALALYDGREAVMTQSYGPEARGGASSANIIVSDREIAYPFVQQPNILVAMSQEAYAKYYPTVRADGLILIDSDLVTPEDVKGHYFIPATQLAEDCGRRIVANMVMLGYFCVVTNLVRRKAMEKAIDTTVKPKTKALNLKAFATGTEFGTRELSRS